MECLCGSLEDEEEKFMVKIAPRSCVDFLFKVCGSISHSSLVLISPVVLISSLTGKHICKTQLFKTQIFHHDQGNRSERGERETKGRRFR
jgi:hypothetical protein